MGDARAWLWTIVCGVVLARADECVISSVRWLARRNIGRRERRVCMQWSEWVADLMLESGTKGS